MMTVVVVAVTVAATRAAAVPVPPAAGTCRRLVRFGRVRLRVVMFRYLRGALFGLIQVWLARQEQIHRRGCCAWPSALVHPLACMRRLTRETRPVNHLDGLKWIEGQRPALHESRTADRYQCNGRGGGKRQLNGVAPFRSFEP